MRYKNRLKEKRMSLATKKNLGTAVVTGASSGIGREYAEQLAERGYDLVVVARRADRLQELATELGDRYGTKVTTVIADLSAAPDVKRVAAVLRDHPAVTLLVNNAGVMLMGSTTEAKLDEVEALLEVNVSATVILSVAALNRFTTDGGGTLVNVGSILGFAGYPGTSVYSATKAFVLSFTQGLQAEHVGSNIKIQLVAPAGIATEGWDSSVVDSSLIMSAKDCVHASLKSLDLGESIALPSVEHLSLLKNYVDASTALMGSAQTGKPASRYSKG
jgi:short-subunit dehydrogenase